MPTEPGRPLLHDVHFATVHPAIPSGARALLNAGSGTSDAAVAAVLIVLFVAFPAVPPSWLRSPAFWGIVAAVVVLGGASLILFWRLGPGRPRAWPFKSNGDARVRVAGPPRLLERLSMVRDESFEPVVFSVYESAAPDRSLRSIARIASVVLIGAAIWGLTHRLIPGHPVFSYWQVLAALAVARLTDSWMWPAYIRLAPGQIEVIKYGWLGRGGPSITTVDLRATRVLLTRGVVHVRTDSEDLLIGGVNTPERAEAVLRAAVSTAPTPPLPKDALG